MENRLDKVTDVFAFSMKHGALTDTIFYSGGAYPRDTPEKERDALDAANSHINESARALLRSIDAALLADERLGAVLSQEAKRDSTLDKNWWLDRWMASFGNIWLWVSIRKPSANPGEYYLQLGVWFRQAMRETVQSALRGHIIEWNKSFVVTAQESLDKAERPFEELAKWCVRKATEAIDRLGVPKSDEAKG